MDTFVLIHRRWLIAGWSFSLPWRAEQGCLTMIIGINGDKTFSSFVKKIFIYVFKIYRPYVILNVLLPEFVRAKQLDHDQVPPEACAYNAAELARLSYSQLLKLALHGQEAAMHKGGQLVQAHKGKGPMDLCESYRSLLIS